MSPRRKKYKYWAWMPWIRWFVPLPIILLICKRHFGIHIWYQDDECELKFSKRYPD